MKEVIFEFRFTKAPRFIKLGSLVLRLVAQLMGAEWRIKGKDWRPIK